MRDVVQHSNGSNVSKPAYKDYRAFLHSYDSKSAIATAPSPEARGSSAGAQPSSSDNEVPKSYGEFLQSAQSKKFGSVRVKLPGENFKAATEKPPVTKNSARNGGDRTDGETKKVVRSELFVNINGGSEIRNKSISPPPPQQKLLSPRCPENNVVPDHLIYTKTAVLEELLTSSPKLKTVPPSFAKKETKIYKTEEINEVKSEENNVRRTSETSPVPPPLPTSKPPVLAKKFHNHEQNQTRIHQQLPKACQNQDQRDQQCEEEMIRELQRILIAKETVDALNSIPEPPKFIQQQLQAKYLEPNTTTVVPVTDLDAEIDKNDPNVKKLVYNTYRGLLGAYNNKANDIVSTLPRNAVVVDKGVGKQVESIASQGCLDRLNGRVNPNPSPED